MRLQERIFGLQPITLFGHASMPRQRKKKVSDKLNEAWTLCHLELLPSLVYAGHIQGLDNCMQAMKSGSMSLEKVMSFFKSVFEERLLPGILSKLGLTWLESHRGQAVAVFIAQCPQRGATFQLKDGCKTNTYLDALIAEV